MSLHQESKKEALLGEKNSAEDLTLKFLFHTTVQLFFIFLDYIDMLY